MTRDSFSASPDDIEVITFEIGEQSFCVDVRQVREIRGWSPEAVTALKEALAAKMRLAPEQTDGNRGG